MSENSLIKVGSPLQFKSPSSMKSLDDFSTPNSLKKRSMDRFIPSSVSANLYQLYFSQDGKIEEEEEENKGKQNTREINALKNYSNLLQANVLEDENNKMNISTEPKKNLLKSKKLLKYNSDKKNLENFPDVYNPFLLSCKETSKQTIRNISKVPTKVLDAPGLQDDFYLNLLDWSPSNILSVGLENCAYIWSACNSKVTKICEQPETDMVSSVSWSQRGNILGVGNSYGEIHLYDAMKSKKIREITGHTGRVGSLAWNGNLIASGSRDRSILVHDLRSPSLVQKFQGHKQEICGLRWSFDEQYLSSGGNDNKLFLWSIKSRSEVTKFTSHCAAVKAMAWSPHQHNLLVSGGGTADRTIRFWNTQTLTQEDVIDTGSQVCNLLFSKNVNELVSTHGYSLNQINVWKLPKMQKISTLIGHTYRVLYLAGSPCGQTIVTGAGDETLRFWNVFPSSKSKDGINPMSTLNPSTFDLR